MPQAQNARNYITNCHPSTKAYKARNEPPVKPMCANLTPFEQICTSYKFQSFSIYDFKS
jgi:hypothetical protein